jgi:hypothetical protein
MGLDLLARSGLPTEVRAGVAFLTVDDALRLVDLARAEGVVILGMDGFRVQGSSTIPLMDWIADFSPVAGTQSGAATSWNSAKEFLLSLPAANLGDDVRVEVTLAS